MFSLFEGVPDATGRKYSTWPNEFKGAIADLLRVRIVPDTPITESENDEKIILIQRVREFNDAVLEPPSVEVSNFYITYSWHDLNGQLHRDFDLPAFIRVFGSKTAFYSENSFRVICSWYQHGKLARRFGLPQHVGHRYIMKWCRDLSASFVPTTITLPDGTVRQWPRGHSTCFLDRAGNLYVLNHDNARIIVANDIPNQ